MPASAFALIVPADRKGAFIHRSVDGVGSVNLFAMRVGVVQVAGNHDVKAFAVEMVYVPQGSFFIGDGNGTSESLMAFHTGTTESPALISATLTGDVQVDLVVNDDAQLTTQGIGIDGDDGLDTDDDGTIDNPLFPTGFNAFYSMKYELSQRGYTDFINTLTYDQQSFEVGCNPSDAPGASAFGLGDIEIDVSGIANTVPAVFAHDGDLDDLRNETDDGEWQAAFGFSWLQLCAWLDWAALRPMTELEFEKICRGPAPPQLNEFAWGTSNIFSSPYIFTNVKTANEVASNASTSAGNAIYNATASALTRTGSFATATTNRTTSGASFFGVLDMSGNVSERTVNVGSAAGRSFTGKTGDGNLNALGHADVDFWPGINGNTDPNTPNAVYGGTTGVTDLAGSGLRGGAYNTVPDWLQISQRFRASFMEVGVSGGRGVRSSN